MSFLVLVIQDRVQKQLVNLQRRKHPSSGDYGLVYYNNGGKTDTDNNLELPEDMPIVEAYFQHVERYIYSHPKARKMLSLDGDPVRAWAAREHFCGTPPPVRPVHRPLRHVASGRRCSLRCSCARWRT